jgi:hypothetical protein
MKVLTAPLFPIIGLKLPLFGNRNDLLPEKAIKIPGSGAAPK